ncbi:MAG: DUF4391 domain-containing protein [Sphingobacteriaceae bacterium]|nr:DUF4391 domain-containing protein [Sphingobacteriaceae bacterium]
MFRLPSSSLVNKVIPKNAFETFANPTEKRQLTAVVAKITWLHKLSPNTINLEGDAVQELQIFQVELKKKQDINGLLKLIDKSIPYHIIFIIQFEHEYYLSVSAKHLHPTNPNNAVIDWTFTTEWKAIELWEHKLELRLNLDHVFNTFCESISGRNTSEKKVIGDLIEYSKKRKELEHKIAQTKSAIDKTTQFNQKVNLNLELQRLRNELLKLIE